MTENEKNLRDLEEWFKMNPTEGAAYAFQKKQLEDEMAHEAGQAATSPIRQATTQAPPDTQASPSLEGGASVETAAPMPVIPKIHVTVGGKKIGAFEREEVIRRIRAGEIRRDARVWKDGMPDWVDAGDLPELETYFDEMKGFYAEEERHKREAAQAAEAKKREAEQAAARAAEAEEKRKREAAQAAEARKLYYEALELKNKYHEKFDSAFNASWAAASGKKPNDNNKDWGLADSEKARELLMKAAEMGSAKAQALLADCYKTQELGFLMDPAKASYWLAKAKEQLAKEAEQGDPESCYELGFAYMDYSAGFKLGVPHDYVKAEELLNKAIAGAGYNKDLLKKAQQALKEVEKKLGKRGLFGKK